MIKPNSTFAFYFVIATRLLSPGLGHAETPECAMAFLSLPPP
jgi:hypothetical protein